MDIPNFPNDNIDPKEKGTKKYGKKVAESIVYHGYTESLSYKNNVKKIRENRDYAANNQSVDQYKPLLNASIDTKGDTSMMNISWEIATPCEKFVHTVMGDMMNQDHKIQFNAISPYARTKREKDRDAYYGKLLLQRELASIEEETGLVLTDKKGFNPKDEAEIELYMDMEYRQPIEIGMEEIVDFELYNNDWTKKVKNRVIKDLVVNNVGRCRIYFDENSKIRLRYVDLENYIAPYTTEPDYSDVDYEGEVVYMTIKELRLRDSKKEVSEQQWEKLAQKSSAKYGNPPFRNFNLGNYNEKDFPYNDFRVPVLDFVYYTVDQSYWEESTSAKGRNYFDKRAWGYKNEKSNVIVKEREVSYEGLYILGISTLIQYGLSQNMLRHKDNHDKEKTSPKLVRRYVSFQLEGKSIVEVMKPNIDTIQLLVLKKRHFIAESNPAGIAIDVSGLKDTMALLNITDPMQIVQVYKQKGIGFYSKVDVNGDPTSGYPIQELGSPFAQLLLSLDNSIISEVNTIRENIGINDAKDGTSENKDGLVGIEKLKILASNNVTRELYNGFLNGILAPIGKVMSRMVQYKIIFGDGIKEYEDIIGKQGVKSIEFAKDAEMSDLGIKIESLPTGEEVADLLNMLNLSLQNGEIKPEDYLATKRILNTKKAERFLAQKRKQYAEEKMIEFQQKEQITGEREQQSALAAAEAQKIKEQAKAEALIMLEEAKTRFSKDLNDHEAMNKIKVIDRESYWDMKKIEEANKHKQEEEDSKPSTGGERVFQDPARTATRTDTLIN